MQSSPHQSANYRADIDGLRAISIILVLLYHGFPKSVPGGYIGVDVFFVISGYLITGHIYGQSQAGNFSIVNFYAKRIRRIFPSLIVVLFFVATYGALRLNLSDFSSLYEHLIASVGFFSNFLLWSEAGYFDTQAGFKPLLHLWSLAIEEQFYIAWPALIILGSLCGRRIRNFLPIAIATACLASLFYSAFAVAHEPVAAFYSPLSRFWELAAGGLLAIWQANAPNSQSLPRVIANIASASALLALFLCGFLFTDKTPFPGFIAVIPVLSAVVVIQAGPTATMNRRLLSSKPMVGLGLISYAVYLWHWPLLSFLRIESLQEHRFAIPLALIASVVLGLATRLFVENKVRFRPNRYIPFWLAGAALLIGVIGIIGARGLYLPERLQVQSDIRSRIEAADKFDVRGIPVKPCTDFISSNSLADRFCRVWGRDNATKTIVLWGDSMSNVWTTPFLSLQRTADIRIIQFSHAACPPIAGVHRTNDSFAKEWCNDPLLQDQILKAVGKIRPSIVFLIARWNLYYHGNYRNDSLVEPSFITDEATIADAVSAKLAFERKLPRTIDTLAAISNVVVFKGTPLLKVPISEGLATRPENFEYLTAEHVRFEADINRIIDQSVSRHNNVVAYDPSPAFCGPQKCSAFVRNRPAYVDDVHLTAATTLTFTPVVSRFIFSSKPPADDGHTGK